MSALNILRDSWVDLSAQESEAEAIERVRLLSQTCSRRFARDSEASRKRKVIIVLECTALIKSIDTTSRSSRALLNETTRVLSLSFSFFFFTFHLSKLTSPLLSRDLALYVLFRNLRFHFGRNTVFFESESHRHMCIENCTNNSCGNNIVVKIATKVL